jgi:hypothetical protein
LAVRPSCALRARRDYARRGTVAALSASGVACVDRRRGPRGTERSALGARPPPVQRSPHGGTAHNAKGATATQRPAFGQALRQRRSALVYNGPYEWAGPTPGKSAALSRSTSTPPTAIRSSSPAFGAPSTGHFGLAPSSPPPMPPWPPCPTACLWPCPSRPGTSRLGPGPLGPRRLDELFQPAPEGVLRCQRVGAAVISARNDGLSSSLP